jgi:hypothetical protein
MELTNLIGMEVLDMPVLAQEKLTTFSRFDLLVFDPGHMVGWAGVVSTANYVEQNRVGYLQHIEVGQGHWNECLEWVSKQVVIERTPFAARRTFDPWPLYFTGTVLAKMHPQEPSYVMPTNLKVANKWFKLPRGHGLGPHAKDALSHLVYTLVRQSTDGSKTG